jgi:hypothetical protein
VILELGDGREVRLPDSMDDETARQLKRLLLGGEERAAAAEARASALEQRMAALEARKPVDLAPLTAAIGEMHRSVVNGNESIASALARIERVAGADREMVADEYGEMRRSRIV